MRGVVELYCKEFGYREERNCSRFYNLLFSVFGLRENSCDRMKRAWRVRGFRFYFCFRGRFFILLGLIGFRVLVLFLVIWYFR